MHPTSVLFKESSIPVTLPACDHYAGSEKLMRKSLALQKELGPVFDITFDCEDGAAAGDEIKHATLVGDLIASTENNFERVGARVHDPVSPFFVSDVEHICHRAAKKLAYIVVPKVTSATQLQSAIALIQQHAQAAGRTALAIHALIETHSALHEVWEIAALPEIACLSFGIMDFVSSHHGAIPSSAMQSPRQFNHPLVVRAKLEISAACHAHGIVASHNVTTEIDNLQVMRQDAKLAKQEFGFERMWSIHPNQIRPIVDTFAPGSDEIETALEILLAAQAENWGPLRHQGKLHDRASYRYYWSILQKARMSGQSLPTTAASLV